MPVVKWGVDAGDVEDFDRDSQFKPYAGPIPPDGVYAWRVKRLQHVAGSRDKNPQLRPGLELVPREGFDEDKYAGYYLMDFLPVAGNTAFRYVPLLDALGVSGRDFTSRTKTDVDGNIISIGKWSNKGDAVVVAQLVTEKDQNGTAQKKIRAASYGDLGDDIELSDEDSSEDELPDDDELDADVIPEDYDDDEPQRSTRRSGARDGTRGSTTGKKTARRNGTVRKAATRVRASRKRPSTDDDDYVGF